MYLIKKMGEDFFFKLIKTHKGSKYLQKMLSNNKLKEYGFKTDHSYGYMWYVEHFNVMRPAVLRRGLIRAEK